VGSPEDAVTAAEVGADILAHQVYRGRLGPGDAAAIADAGAVMIPTMHVFTVSAALAEQRHTPSAMDRAMYPPAVLEAVTGEAAAPFVEADAMATIGATLNTWEDAWADNLRLLHAAGVPFLVGTDAALPGVLPGPALHAELEALVDAGLSPTEALYGATGLLAATLGEGDFGTLVVGGPGEAVLVRGDPTTDIRATRDIVWVTRMGRRHTTVWNE
jgi:imidazolonepropionase-like amidohydrolase